MTTTITPAAASLDAEIGNINQRIVQLRAFNGPRHELLKAMKMRSRKIEERVALDVKTPFDLVD